MELLRIATAGSVDDGKSTLIGRLLYDSKAIYDDVLDSTEQHSRRQSSEYFNLALLTDGLKVEREQGITIDVAYRYFSTPKRKFILADTPGHVQYTRNMVTGASTADVALIIVDARHGVVEQSRRHAVIGALLGIKHVVVCINKMDLVDFKEEFFRPIQDDLHDLLTELEIKSHHFIPISALEGDNVVEKSDRMPWYIDGPLLPHLEDLELPDNTVDTPFRFPVQYVIRPMSNEYHDYRGYAGTIALSLIAIPVVVRTTDNMLRLVPPSLLEAAYALGAPHWKVALTVRLRAVKAGVVTGVLLAVARVTGETAPLLFTALNNQFYSHDMNAPLANLPVVIYTYAMSPYDDWRSLAWAGALLVTTTVLLLNILSRTLFSQKTPN